MSTPGHRDARRVDRAIPADVRRSPNFLFAGRRLGRRLWCAHLEWTLRRQRPGLIVAFDIRPDGEIAQGLRKKHDVPYVLHLDGPRLAEVRKRIAKGGESASRLQKILDGASSIITSSRACWLEAYRLGILPHRLEIIPPGVDLKRFHPGERSAALAERVGLRRGPALLTLAGGSAGRDLETVLRAFAVIGGQRRDSTLVVVGPEDSRPWKKLVRQLRIDRSVKFVGAIPDADMPEWYRMADALLMAHRAPGESVPAQGVEVSILEAMASGLPVFATRTPATEELVPTDDLGVLVDPGAHAKLGKAAAAILGDQEAVREMGEAARKHAETAHDAVRCGQTLRELLEAIYFRRLRLGELEAVPDIVGAGSARPAA